MVSSTPPRAQNIYVEHKAASAAARFHSTVICIVSRELVTTRPIIVGYALEGIIFLSEHGHISFFVSKSVFAPCLSGFFSLFLHQVFKISKVSECDFYSYSVHFR